LHDDLSTIAKVKALAAAHRSSHYLAAINPDAVRKYD
jgi:hypothetical protein